jgi:hypothetical protein
MRRTLLSLAIAATAASVSAQTLPSWADRTGALTVAPSYRRAGAMAFDGTTNRLILYGGVSPAPAQVLGETWAFNGTWTQLNPPGGALPRWGHRLVRNTAQNRLITFGGRSPTISGLANDTYAWTGTAWTLVPSPTAPAARFRYGLAYDTRRNRVVLFGGRGLTTVLGDTWEFDGIAWTEVVTPTSPPPREDMVMAYDPALARTVMFGGYDPDTDTIRGDTWEWSGVNWQEIPITGGPSARFRSAGVFDSIRQRLVMYGGFDGTNVLQETWEYVGGTWTLVPALGSALATEMYAAYDSQRRKTVTFGGVGAAFSNETWEFTGGTAGALGTFGDGCPTSVGIATPTTAAVAKTGQTYTIDWVNLPVTTTAVAVGYGVSNVLAFGSIPLPIDLAIIGYAGCNLLVSPDAVNTVPAAGGVASSSLVIPNDPTLVNVSLYAQLLIPDEFAPNAVGGTSIGTRSLIGN